MKFFQVVYSSMSSMKIYSKHECATQAFNITFADRLWDEVVFCKSTLLPSLSACLQKYTHVIWKHINTGLSLVNLIFCMSFSKVFE